MNDARFCDLASADAHTFCGRISPTVSAQLNKTRTISYDALARVLGHNLELAAGLVCRTPAQSRRATYFVSRALKAAWNVTKFRFGACFLQQTRNVSMLLKRCVPFLSGSRRRGTALFARMRAAEAPPREAAARSPGEAAARLPMHDRGRRGGEHGDAEADARALPRRRREGAEARALRRRRGCGRGEAEAALGHATPAVAQVFRCCIWWQRVAEGRHHGSAEPHRPWALWRHVERREARSTRSASPRGRSASPRVRRSRCGPHVYSTCKAPPVI